MLTLSASVAIAQGGVPLQLSWRAPTGCPTAAQVQARIQKLVAADAPPLRAEVTIAPRADGRLQLRLVVRTSDLVEERELAGQTCEDVSNAAVIHLALLMQSGPSQPADTASASAARSVDTVPSSLETENTAQPGAAAAASPSSDSPGSERASPPSQARIALQLPLALFGLGELPRPEIGLGVAGGIRLAHWLWLVDVRAWRAQRAPLDDSRPGADLQLAALSVRACRALTSGSIELSPCLRVGVEQLWARGAGPHVGARTARQTWAAAALGLQGRLQVLAWLGLVAQLEVQLGTARPRIVIDGEGELARLRLVSVHFGLGAEWIF